MNLRDQLKKAKLLSDKDARRLAHQERVERKDKGREQLEHEQQQRDQELQAARQGDRQRTKAQQRELEAARKQQAERAAVLALLSENARKPRGGPGRFYFETPDGSLPWLALSQREMQELAARQLCVVRALAGAAGSETLSTGHDYRLLAAEFGERVASVLGDAVVYPR